MSLAGVRNCLRVSFGIFCFVHLCAVAAFAEDVALPTNPAQWINSPPLTNEMLTGKAVYLYYFEEGCPSCRAKWPSLIESAKKYAGKPVVFIGVNSGNNRNEVEDYVREVGLPWPVIVDTDRAIEKTAGVGTISLDNIYQAQILMPDGKLTGGSSSDVEGTVDRGLATAKWRVDPAQVPEALKPAWLQVEFGNFAAASMLIKKGVNNPKTDIKEAAMKLQAAVDKELQERLEAGRREQSAGQKWAAYKSFVLTASRFKGYELPTDVTKAMQELAADAQVKNEMVASKQWEAAQRGLNAPNAATRNMAAGQLQRLIKQFPGTEAAQLSQAALDQLATSK